MMHFKTARMMKEHVTTETYSVMCKNTLTDLLSARCILSRSLTRKTSFYKARVSSNPSFAMRQRMLPDLKGHYWVRRSGIGKFIGRMPLVPIYAGAAYCLRALIGVWDNLF